jgi:hypothetical protein
LSKRTHLGPEKRDIHLQIVPKTFATLAYERFKNGYRRFQGRRWPSLPLASQTTPGAFLADLWSVMNTPKSELRGMYIAVPAGNFRGTRGRRCGA